MIDRNARDTIAEATRHYLAGLSTNYVFDDAIFKLLSSDPAIEAIQNQLWLIYDDLREHKNEGKWKLAEENRQIAIRIIMFLKSDHEYLWPKVPEWYSALRPIIMLMTFGVGVKVLDQKYKYRDNENVWPFYSQEDIQAAKGDPKYFTSAT